MIFDNGEKENQEIKVKKFKDRHFSLKYSSYWWETLKPLEEPYFREPKKQD